MERTLVSDGGAGDGLGAQARVVSPGAETVVEAFAPYEPTVPWQLTGEQTVAWAVREPRPAPNPWLVGLGSAGLAVAVTLGFCLGRTVPISAVDRTGAAPRTAQTQVAGPAPSIPVVLPAVPDLSRSYPLPSTAPVRTAARSAPKWATAPAPPPITISPVPRRHVAPARAAVRMSAAPVPLPPPVQLYGSSRAPRNVEVVTWRLPRGG